MQNESLCRARCPLPVFSCENLRSRTAGNGIERDGEAVVVPHLSTQVCEAPHADFPCLSYFGASGAGDVSGATCRLRSNFCFKLAGARAPNDDKTDRHEIIFELPAPWNRVLDCADNSLAKDLRVVSYVT